MAKILRKAVQQNLTAKLYSKATLILNAQNKLDQYYKQALRQRYFRKTVQQNFTAKIYCKGLA